MSQPHSVPFYSGDVLEGLAIAPSKVADLIERLIRDRDAGKVWSAPKSSIAVPDDRYAMSTLAIADDPRYLVIKSLLLNPRNPARGEPLMNSIVALQDGETGRPLALLDGNWITAVRTAALSVVAARRMARTDSATIAFVGCGLQARSHLLALGEAFSLTEVRALGRGEANTAALAELAATQGLRFHRAATAKEALRGADLVVTSVTREPGAAPFLDVGDIEPGAFASLVDLGRPWLPGTFGRFDSVVIDDTVQEAGMKDRMVAPELVTGDLADLVMERIEVRRGAASRTGFVFRGYALGDFALAALAYEALRD